MTESRRCAALVLGPGWMTSCALVTALALSACSGGSEASQPSVAAAAQPVVANGGFEEGLDGWSVVANANPHGFLFPPQSVADLQLGPALPYPYGGSTAPRLLTSSRDGATPASEIPAGLSSTATLRLPRYGSRSAVVNELGSGWNVNTLVQRFTATAADVDVADGKIHVRFALAPVLQNPMHPFNEQPYYFVQVRNVTRDTTLFSRFSYSNQPGVPWKSSGDVLYTDWQAFDVAPGDAALGIGDTVELRVVAAGCAESGHFGEVYVDGFGAFLPGLSVAASAPATAGDGEELTYTYLVRNAGDAAVANVVVEQPVPPGVAFSSLAAPGAACTAPAPGEESGKVSCDLGTLDSTASTTFEVTFRIPAGARGTVSNADYTVSGDGVSALIGPLVETTITRAIASADLSVTESDGAACGPDACLTRCATFADCVTGEFCSATGECLDDTMPPVLTTPDELVAEALGPSGAQVSFAVGALDAVAGALPVTCAPEAGSTFPLGVTTVICFADDGHGNTASASFPVRVLDSRPPVLAGLPADLEVEASGPGTVATWEAPTAADLVDGAVPVTCLPSSAGMFPVGETEVTCVATDAAGNTGSGSFSVSVKDTTPPALRGVPADLRVEATGPSGASVAWSAPTADDLVNGPVPVACSPGPGVFALGRTSVACSAADVAGNTVGATFEVEVVDTTPPSLPPLAALVEEATGPTGAVVTWGALAAQDTVDGSVAISCSPSAGAAFPLGTTTVGCSASDARGNTATGTFTVTVRDTTPPQVEVPPEVAAAATSASGAVVTYAASASDAVSGPLVPTCEPPSGSSFPPGSTTVRCTATDAAGNTGTAELQARVAFGWSGLLSPLASGASYRLGRTIPCKFELAGGSAAIADLAARVYLTKVSEGVTGPLLEADSRSTADVGNTFRFDPVTGQYVFNLSTAPLSEGTWILRVDLGDGVPHDALISLRM